MNRRKAKGTSKTMMAATINTEIGAITAMRFVDTELSISL
jgi:hypothetical protein